MCWRDVARSLCPSSGSSSAVASASGTRLENEIWTAGHCLVNTEANNHIVDSSALPSGASTEATLALIKAKTDNLDVLLCQVLLCHLPCGG